MTHDPATSRPEEGGPPSATPEPAPSRESADRVFIGALLLVVLTVIATYLLGDFKGHNAGADFGIIIGVTLIIALFVGLVTAAIHDHRTRHHH